MKRRNFLTTVSSIFLVPLALLRGKPAVAAAAGHTPADSLKHMEETLTPYYKSCRSHGVTMQEFYNEQLGIPYKNPMAELLLDVDYSALRRRGGKAPWIVLEHSAEKDGKGPGRLLIDQLMACRSCSMHVMSSGHWYTEDEPAPPEMGRVLELHLADPNELLLASLLVSGLVAQGVVQNMSFIRAWNQAVIDSQYYQCNQRKATSDAPVYFLGSDYYDGNPKAGPAVHDGRCDHTKSADDLAKRSERLGEQLRDQTFRSPG